MTKKLEKKFGETECVFLRVSDIDDRGLCTGCGETKDCLIANRYRRFPYGAEEFIGMDDDMIKYCSFSP